MSTKAAPAVATAIPQIGAEWPGIAGSAYAGVSRGENGEPDGHLVLLADQVDKRLKWADAVKWAQGLGDGARLPTRFESALLYANLQDKLDQTAWHWTGTQYSSDGAWLQYFNGGGQSTSGKSYEARCRAVRRFVLQSFNPSNVAPTADPGVAALLKSIHDEIKGAREDVQKIFLADIGA